MLEKCWNFSIVGVMIDNLKVTKQIREKTAHFLQHFSNILYNQVQRKGSVLASADIREAHYTDG